MIKKIEDRFAQPVDKVAVINESLGRVEDMLFCLSEFDGRDIRDIFPKFKEFQKAIGNWISREV